MNVDKNHNQRCIYSNKLVIGKEVIIKEYAKDFVLKNDFFDLLKRTK